MFLVNKVTYSEYYLFDLKDTAILAENNLR